MGADYSIKGGGSNWESDTDARFIAQSKRAMGQGSTVLKYDTTRKYGTAPRIQLNDSYKTTKDILDFIAAERDNLSESDRASMTVCLKADRDTKMGVVADVKQELRRANALKLSYASSKVLKE